MAIIHKISFTSENSTNLLKNIKTKPPESKPNDTVQATGSNDSGTLNTNSKKLAYITSAVALASLGVTTAFAIKNGKLTKSIQTLTNGLQDANSRITKLSGELSSANETVSKISKSIDDAAETLTTKVEGRIREKEQQIRDLGKWQDGQIDGLRREVNTRIEQIVTSVKTPGMETINLTPTHVNGMDLQLATVLNGYGKHTEELQKTLRSESAKRIFGIVDRSGITPPDNITIRVPTSEFKGFTSTGGMSVVPKEVIANLGAIINKKQNVRLVVDTPMYLGQVEENVYHSIARQADGSFHYISSKSDKPIAVLEKIDTMNLPIYTDRGKTNEAVELYMARNLEQTVDLDLLIPWLDKGLAEELTAKIASGEHFELDTSILKVKFGPGMEKPSATVKYDAVMYKNDKFRMDGPVVDNATKNIYNNLTHEAGETERFTYFDKYFYESLFRSPETSKDPLGADLIIGNDWQTGGISAMMKLLTTARRYFGLDPKVADKVYNTPVMTIMHNAGLAGNVWHSQPKLLNIMFGEHASMITANAWMPKNAGLGNDALNGLFHGNNLNPQTMAAAYSDIITPVSRGYGDEIASHSGFGGANHDIFRMRARYHEFGDIQHVKYLARENGLNPDLVTEHNLAYKPITNGCDRINNTMTEAIARDLEKSLGLEKETLRVAKSTDEIVEVHNHNKEVYLNKVIEETNMARNGQGNPMNIELAECTNLEGVTKDTPVFSTAGRIVDQKGLDIYAESIEEILDRYHGQGEYPVFYAQGVGDKVYIDKLLDVKRRISAKYGYQAADRIVFARLFSEPGRYDGCKLMSDFTIMSSWFEPCGLVHKEISAFSGAIPIVNKVGGLCDGLTDGVNAIFANFRAKFDNYLDALHYNRLEFANALERAMNIFKNKQQFNDMLKSSYSTNHSWLKPGGPMQEYAQVFVDMKVLKPEVLQHT